MERKRELLVRLPLKRAPSHPGALLREELVVLGLTAAEAARELHVEPGRSRRVLRELAPVTPELAVRVGRWLGNGPTLWLNMQAARDLWYAERALASVLKMIPTRAVT